MPKPCKPDEVTKNHKTSIQHVIPSSAAAVAPEFVESDQGSKPHSPVILKLMFNVVSTCNL